MEKPKYQEMLDHLMTGSCYGVFIDDTGSPGLKNTPGSPHPERKSWVAVIVPPSQIPEVLTQFKEAIDELHSLIGAREFHFADIYAGKKEFKNVDLQVRLTLFEFMAHIFTIYRFPIIVQTLDPKSLERIRSRIDLPYNLAPFDIQKHDDMALLFLLIRIKWHLEKDRKDNICLAHVFVDEGYKRNGIAIRIPIFEEVFVNGLVCFARSASIYPIQLADFAAFSMNRTQLLLGKKKLNQLDKRLLEILSPIAWNYQNIEKQEIKLP